MIDFLSAGCLALASIPAYFYFRNVGVFRRLPNKTDANNRLPISVLIPARNEAKNIAACLEAVLASAGSATEVLVLDDQSTDDTVRIVAQLADRDPRVQLIAGQPLPTGWNGKQHACWQLAQAASRQRLVFLDADVRLTPCALSRIASQSARQQVDLLSGFPRQVTKTLLERLLLPLIHFVLLGFLSLRHMRRVQQPAFAAGCGQLFITTREAYAKSGGHAAIRTTRHDGIKLPRLYLQRGLTIDLFDATDVASVRMYEGGVATWQGLAKNATEGIASPRIILPATLLLLGGQVLPLVLVASEPFSVWAVAATVLVYLPRLDAVRRYRQSLLGAVLHPLGVLVFLTIQWCALLALATGRQVEWKGRAAADAC